VSPSVFEVMAVLGKDEVLNRITFLQNHLQEKMEH
jgi:hypothetical protein